MPSSIASLVSPSSKCTDSVYSCVTLSHYLSRSAIPLGKSSRQHPVSAQI